MVTITTHALTQSATLVVLVLDSDALNGRMWVRLPTHTPYSVERE